MNSDIEGNEYNCRTLSIDVQEGFFDLLCNNDSSMDSVDHPNKVVQTKHSIDKSLTKSPDVINPFKSNENWSDYMLCKSLLKAISDLGFEYPTVVQSKIIPLALEGKDILVTAETGSGKTAAFLIPILQRLVTMGGLRQTDKSLKHFDAARGPTKALVLLPTRELAAQCFNVFQSLSKYMDVNGILLTGGIPIKEQEVKLKFVHEIIISTPGRILDILINSGCINMDGIEIVIMDEADRLLELGFIDECLKILNYCNKKRQTMLFSATLTKQTRDLVKLSLVNPIYINAVGSTQISKSLKFEMILIPSDDLREACTLYLCEKHYKTQTILFFQTKKAAHRMAVIFQLLNFKFGELHGNLSQSKRFESIEKFKSGEINYILASELASRGLDIPGITTVINVHLPTDITRYIHRVGRTARMGAQGKAVTLYTEEEKTHVKMILKNTCSVKETLEKHRRKISREILKGRIQTILLNERLEKDIRLCEYAAKRTGEDANSGKRLWFRSVKEKKLSSKNELIERKEQIYRNIINDAAVYP